jgi:hypothetical protein
VSEGLMDVRLLARTLALENPLGENSLPRQVLLTSDPSPTPNKPQSRRWPNRRIALLGWSR